MEAAAPLSLLDRPSEGGAPAPLPHVSADELARLVCAFEAEQAAEEVFAQLSPDSIAGCVRAAAFLGLDALRKAAVTQLAAALRGMSVDDMRAATGAADGADMVSAEQKAAVDEMFSMPSVERLRAVGAALSGESDGGFMEDVLGLEWNSVLELTAVLDLRDLPTFAKASRSACGLLFDPQLQREKDVFLLWSAVFQQKHSALAEMFAAPGSHDDGAEAWEARTLQVFGLWNVLRWLEDPEAVETAWVWSWLREQALAAGSPPAGTLANVPCNLTSSVVYSFATQRPSSSTPDQAAACCGLAEEAIGLATDASSRRVAAIISRLAGANDQGEPEPQLESEPEPELEAPASHGAVALPATLLVGSVDAAQHDAHLAEHLARTEGTPGLHTHLEDHRQQLRQLRRLRPAVADLLESEWQRLATAHAEVGEMFAYLDQYYLKRLGDSLAAIAAQSREQGDGLWRALILAGFVPPPPEKEPEADLEAEVVLVFSREATLQVEVAQLTDCESLMVQVQQTRRATTAGQLPRVMVSGCSKAAMMKLLEFSAGLRAMADATDEDKLAWVGEYKKSMEPQDQLPLLFQTMTAANVVGHKVLLDELCKFVAELIAQRTPNEILDYFNIKNDATWEEEQELIATHSWIDPEGLIAKDREKRLAEKAAEQA